MPTSGDAEKENRGATPRSKVTNSTSRTNAPSASPRTASKPASAPSTKPSVERPTVAKSSSSKSIRPSVQDDKRSTTAPRATTSTKSSVSTPREGKTTNGLSRSTATMTTSSKPASGTVPKMSAATLKRLSASPRPSTPSEERERPKTSLARSRADSPTKSVHSTSPKKPSTFSSRHSISPVVTAKPSSADAADLGSLEKTPMTRLTPSFSPPADDVPTQEPIRELRPSNEEKLQQREQQSASDASPKGSGTSSLTRPREDDASEQGLSDSDLDGVRGSSDELTAPLPSRPIAKYSREQLKRTHAELMVQLASYSGHYSVSAKECHSKIANLVADYAKDLDYGEAEGFRSQLNDDGFEIWMNPVRKTAKEEALGIELHETSAAKDTLLKKFERLQSDHISFEKQHEEMREELQAEQKRLSAELAKLQADQAASADQNAECERLRSDNEGLSGKIAEVESELVTVQREKDSVANELELLQGEKDIFAMQLESLKIEDDKTRGENNSLAKENARHVEVLDDLHKRLQEATAINSELERIPGGLDGLYEKIRTLQEQVEDGGNVDAVEARCNLLQEQNAGLEHTISVLSRQAAEHSSQMDDERLQAEKALAQRLDDMSEQHSEELAHALSQAASKRAEIEKAKQTLEEQLIGYEHREVAREKDQAERLAEIERVRKELRSTVEQLNAVKRQNATEASESQKNQQSKLHDELSGLKSELQKAQAEAEQFKLEIAELGQSCLALDEVKRELQECKSTLQDREAELREAQNFITTSATESAHHQMEAVELRSEIEHLKEAMENARHEIELHVREQQAAKDRDASTVKEHHDQQVRWEMEMHEKEESIRSLMKETHSRLMQQKRSEFEGELEMVKQQLNSQHEGKMRALESKFNNISEDRKAIQKEHDTVLEEKETMERELARMVSTISLSFRKAKDHLQASPHADVFDEKLASPRHRRNTSDSWTPSFGPLLADYDKSRAILEAFSRYKPDVHSSLNDNQRKALGELASPYVDGSELSDDPLDLGPIIERCEDEFGEFKSQILDNLAVFMNLDMDRLDKMWDESQQFKHLQIERLEGLITKHVSAVDVLLEADVQAAEDEARGDGDALVVERNVQASCFESPDMQGSPVMQQPQAQSESFEKLNSAQLDTDASLSALARAVQNMRFSFSLRCPSFLLNILTTTCKSYTAEIELAQVDVFGWTVALVMGDGRLLVCY